MNPSFRRAHVARRTSVALAALGAVALAAGAAQAQAETTTEIQALAEQTVSETSWGEPLTEANWLCALSGVKGDFNDVGGSTFWNEVALKRGWQLHVGIKREGRAACTRWSNFKVPAGSIRMVGGDFLAADSCSTSCSAWTNTWFGDAALMLNGMAGTYADGTDTVMVAQSSSLTQGSSLQMHVDPPTPSIFKAFNQARAAAIFWGIPLAGLVKLLGNDSAGNLARGTMTTLANTGAAIHSLRGFNRRTMVPTNPDATYGGHCYFTRISGAFDGAGERVTITRVNGYWELQMEDNGNWGDISVHARCMAYDQR